jgi:3-oxo-4-pregnene-20-carboxyl-CoA dehydrogenase alpha subunit
MLEGVKIAVSFAQESAIVLVPATVLGAGTGVFLVPPDTDGISHDVHPTATGQPASRIGLDAVWVGEDTLLGGRADGAAAADLARHALAGVAATVSGVLAGALKLTTEHVKNREQFGRPLAEFQAVTMQVADVYIASRALDAAMWASCWRLGPAAGLGHVGTDELLAVAAWHAAGPALRARDDLRRRCERGAGGADCDDRPRPAKGAAVT